MDKYPGYLDMFDVEQELSFTISLEDWLLINGDEDGGGGGGSGLEGQLL